MWRLSDRKKPKKMEEKEEEQTRGSKSEDKLKFSKTQEAV